MINIENEKPKSKKSFLEKIAPLVLIIVIIYAVWMFKGYFIKDSNTSENLSGDNQSSEQVEVQALIDFINSEIFTKLVFVPDPSIFDQVENVNIITGENNSLN
ncbi:MAG: hypothetical protein WC909_02705 [Candidatus Paceibacterota bacterium]|jgi:hypothetical protein